MRKIRRGYKQGGLVEKIDPEKYVETYEDGSKLYKINSFVRDIATYLSEDEVDEILEHEQRIKWYRGVLEDSTKEPYHEHASMSIKRSEDIKKGIMDL
tara:strand:- start:389 stop:682 length:294 start_codon:yes stop_codon:yes gene_type:complete